MPSSYTLGEHFKSFIKEQVEEDGTRPRVRSFVMGCGYWRRSGSVVRRFSKACGVRSKKGVAAADQSQPRRLGPS